MEEIWFDLIYDWGSDRYWRWRGFDLTWLTIGVVTDTGDGGDFTWLVLIPRRRQQRLARAGSSVHNKIPFSTVLDLPVCLYQRQLEWLAVFSYIVYPSLLGRPLCRIPQICPYNSILGNLSWPMRTTCPKYASRLYCNVTSSYLSIPSSFFISMLRLIFLLVTPRIRRRTDISKTWSFRLYSSLSFQVSALYSRIDWTKSLVWFNLDFIADVWRLPNTPMSHYTCRQSNSSYNVLITCCITRQCSTQVDKVTCVSKNGSTRSCVQWLRHSSDLQEIYLGKKEGGVKDDTWDL